MLAQIRDVPAAFLPSGQGGARVKSTGRGEKKLVNQLIPKILQKCVNEKYNIKYYNINYNINHNIIALAENQYCLRNCATLTI